MSRISRAHERQCTVDEVSQSKGFTFRITAMDVL
jgi:hypothetical protein